MTDFTTLILDEVDTIKIPHVTGMARMEHVADGSSVSATGYLGWGMTKSQVKKMRMKLKDKKGLDPQLLKNEMEAAKRIGKATHVDKTLKANPAGRAKTALAPEERLRQNAARKKTAAYKKKTGGQKLDDPFKALRETSDFDTPI